MKTSQELNKILPALMLVKSKLQAVTKGANNPFFKSKYADLNTYLDEVEPLLQENKMMLLQPVTVDSTTGSNVVASVIMHESGQFVTSEMNISGQNLDAQKMGAAVTYFRRYTLGSLLAMKAEDDDGNTASGKTKEAKPAVTTTTIAASTVTTKADAQPTPTTKPSFKRPDKAAPKVQSAAPLVGDDL